MENHQLNYQEKLIFDTLTILILFSMMGGLMIVPFYPVLATFRDIDFTITGIILCSFSFGGIDICFNNIVEIDCFKQFYLFFRSNSNSSSCKKSL